MPEARGNAAFSTERAPTEPQQERLYLYCFECRSIGFEDTETYCGKCGTQAVLAPVRLKTILSGVLMRPKRGNGVSKTEGFHVASKWSSRLKINQDEFQTHAAIIIGEDTEQSLRLHWERTGTSKSHLYCDDFFCSLILKRILQTRPHETRVRKRLQEELVLLTPDADAAAAS